MRKERSWHTGRWSVVSPAGVLLAGVLVLTTIQLPAAAQPRASAACLAALEGTAEAHRVIPAEVCPRLVAELSDAGAPPDLGSMQGRAIPASDLRALARSLQHSTAGQVRVEPDRVSSIVAENHLTRVPTWLQQLLDWLESQEPETDLDMAWLKGLFDWMSDNRDGLLLLLEGALAALVLALLIWIIAGLGWPRLRWPDLRRGRGISASSRAERGTGHPDRLEDIAAMAEADQAPAVLAWLIREWERSARFPGAARMTDGQILRRLSRHPADMAASFQELARVAEAALYGGRVPDAAHRQRCFEIAGALAQGLGRRP